jgi:hypothetical protein
MVKEEFKDIELHYGGGLNLMFIRDTQPSSKVDIYGYRGNVFLDLWFQRCSASFRDHFVILDDCIPYLYLYH